MHRIILFAATLYTALLIIWQIIINTGTRDYWFVQLLNNFGVWFYLPLVFLLPCLLYRKSRKQLSLLLLVPLLLFTWEYSWCFLPQWDTDNASKSLRVMSWNLHYDNLKPHAIAEVIKSQNPDIVAFQELVESNAKELSQILEEAFPERVIPPTFEFGVFSRYPLKADLSLNSPSNKFQEVRVVLAEGEIALINVHLPTPAYRVRRWGGILLPIDFNTNKQARSYERLFDRVNTIEQPLLLMGDFNTSDRHYQYRRLSQLLTNSFERAGWGFGLSFPAAIPLVRIDHIFHSSHWDTRSVWTHKGVGSEQKLEVSPTETLREHTTVPRNRGNRCNSEKPAPRR